MITSILDKRFLIDRVFADILEDAMNDRNLLFNANSLLEIGFRSGDEVEQAIARAKSICTCNGLPLYQHFKTIYVSDDGHHTVQRDWKLSRLAYTLSILNGASDNPMVAKLQMTILDRYLAKQAT